MTTAPPPPPSPPPRCSLRPDEDHGLIDVMFSRVVDSRRLPLEEVYRDGACFHAGWLRIWRWDILCKTLNASTTCFKFMLSQVQVP